MSYVAQSYRFDSHAFRTNPAITACFARPIVLLPRALMGKFSLSGCLVPPQQDSLTACRSI